VPPGTGALRHLFRYGEKYTFLRRVGLTEAYNLNRRNQDELPGGGRDHCLVLCFADPDQSAGLSGGMIRPVEEPIDKRAKARGDSATEGKERPVTFSARRERLQQSLCRPINDRVSFSRPVNILNISNLTSFKEGGFRERQCGRKHPHLAARWKISLRLRISKHFPAIPGTIALCLKERRSQKKSAGSRKSRRPGSKTGWLRRAPLSLLRSCPGLGVIKSIEVVVASSYNGLRRCLVRGCVMSPLPVSSAGGVTFRLASRLATDHRTSPRYAHDDDQPPSTPSKSKGWMIVGIGTDLIDSSRVERELSQRQWGAGESVFTAKEVRLCGLGRRRVARMSACFAAKEAALKALGADVEDLGVFREVELLFGPSGAPRIVLHSRMQAKAQSLGVKRIWVSIASAKKHACASVVMES